MELFNRLLDSFDDNPKSVCVVLLGIIIAGAISGWLYIQSLKANIENHLQKVASLTEQYENENKSKEELNEQILTLLKTRIAQLSEQNSKLRSEFYIFMDESENILNSGDTHVKDGDNGANENQKDRCDKCIESVETFRSYLRWQRWGLQKSVDEYEEKYNDIFSRIIAFSSNQNGKTSQKIRDMLNIKHISLNTDNKVSNKFDSKLFLCGILALFAVNIILLYLICRKFSTRYSNIEKNEDFHDS